MRKSRLQRNFIISCLLLISYTVSAQTVKIEGIVRDSVLNKPLMSATVSLARATDSSLISFTRANDEGYFQFKNITAGKYLVSISYVGYQHTWIAVRAGSTATLSLGNIYLQDASQSVVKLFGANHTPQAFIIWRENNKWLIKYNGAIDDNGQHPEKAIPYVAQALRQLLAGKPVLQPKTESFGCRIMLRK